MEVLDDIEAQSSLAGAEAEHGKIEISSNHSIS